jgi:hypothetical protein
MPLTSPLTREIWVTECCTGTSHKIVFIDATILARGTDYMDRQRKKDTETELQPNNFNSDNGFMVS